MAKKVINLEEKIAKAKKTVEKNREQRFGQQFEVDLQKQQRPNLKLVKGGAER